MFLLGILAGEFAHAITKAEAIEKLENKISECEDAESSWLDPKSLFKDACTISAHERWEKTVEAAKDIDDAQFCSCYSELEKDFPTRSTPIENFCKGMKTQDIITVMTIFTILNEK